MSERHYTCIFAMSLKEYGEMCINQGVAVVCCHSRIPGAGALVKMPLLPVCPADSLRGKGPFGKPLRMLHY